MRPAAGSEADPPAGAAPGSATAPGSERPALQAAGAVAVLGLIAADVAAVPALLPSVRVELGSSSSGLVWVQAAYLLALAAVSLLLGSLAGRADRRALAVAGVATFAVGALLASTADSTATLVTGRALQGAGTGAMVLPALESLCGAAPRSRWVPALVAAGALGAPAAAPLAGGVIAEEASWRWLFRIVAGGAGPALVLAAVARRSGPREEATARRSRPREEMGALVTGLFLAVTGLVQAGPWGWASADTLLLLAAGAVLLFVGYRPAGLDAVGAALAGCLAAALLLAPQYLELVRGLSPVRSGVLTTVLTLSAATLAGAAWLLRGRLSPRLSVVGGLACATLGALGMTRIDPASSYALVVISLGLLGSGLGAAAGAVATRAGGARFAIAAAAGAALVVAAAGALAQRAQLEEREGGGSFEDALAAGLAASGWLMAALLAAAAVLAWRRAAED